MIEWGGGHHWAGGGGVGFIPSYIVTKSPEFWLKKFPVTGGYFRTLNNSFGLL